MSSTELAIIRSKLRRAEQALFEADWPRLDAREHANLDSALAALTACAEAFVENDIASHSKEHAAAVLNGTLFVLQGFASPSVLNAVPHIKAAAATARRRSTFERLAFRFHRLG